MVIGSVNIKKTRIGVCCIVFSVMLGLTLTLTFQITNNMKKSIIDHLQTITEERSKVIENYIEYAEQMLTHYSKAGEITNVLEHPEDEEALEKAQYYTESYSKDIIGLEGIYVSDWDMRVRAHSNPGIIGFVTREGISLKNFRNSILAVGDGVYNYGIINSPASGQQVISFVKGIYNEEGLSIGVVGIALYSSKLVSILSDFTRKNEN